MKNIIWQPEKHGIHAYVYESHVEGRTLVCFVMIL